jgi:hypothetical protein
LDSQRTQTTVKVERHASSTEHRQSTASESTLYSSDDGLLVKHFLPKKSKKTATRIQKDEGSSEAQRSRHTSDQMAATSDSSNRLDDTVLGTSKNTAAMNGKGKENNKHEAQRVSTTNGALNLKTRGTLVVRSSTENANEKHEKMPVKMNSLGGTSRGRTSQRSRPSGASTKRASAVRPNQAAGRESSQLPGLLRLAGWKEPQSKGMKQQQQQPDEAKLNKLTESHPDLKNQSKAARAPSANEAPEKKMVGVSKQSAPYQAPSNARRQNGVIDNAEARPIDSDAILKRRSDPLPRRQKFAGTTQASMLKQTYSFSIVSARERSNGLSKSADENRRDSSKSAPSALATTDYRLIALGGLAGSPCGKKSTAIVPAESPCLSVNSVNSTGSVPMLSDQALCNAAFLFSPSYAGGNQDMIRPTRVSSESDSTVFTISTLGSRSRLNTAVSAEPITIPFRNLPSTEDFDETSKQSERRVRFSDADDVIAIESRNERVQEGQIAVDQMLLKAVEIPGIDTKLSDLTDVPGFERRESASTTGGIDPIPEESTDSSAHVSFASQENSFIVFEDRDSEEKPSRPSGMQWAYSKGSGMDTGVTPLRSGKSVAHATNSPFLRFKEARTKFTPAKNSNTNDNTNTSTVTAFNSTTHHTEEAVMVKQDSNPVTIPVAGPGWVHSRVVAVESASGKSILGDGGVFLPANMGTGNTSAPKRPATTQSSYLQKKVVGLDVLPSSSSYKKQEWRPLNEARSSSDTIGATMTNKGKAQTSFARSPTLINGEVVDSATKDEPKWRATPPTQVEHDTAKSIQDESQSYDTVEDDVFGDIMHPNTLDEESEDGYVGETVTDLFKSHRAVIEDDRSVDDEVSEDEFDELLNYHQQEDFEEDEDEYSSLDGETVSTIRQDRPITLGAQYSSYRLSFSGQSTASSSVAETVSTVRQMRETLEPKRHSFSSTTDGSTRSSNFSLKQPRLPFREEAPVKPSELNHHTVPGAAHPSPEQSTPGHARKWRALAAAAQERESKRGHLHKPKQASRKGLAELSEQRLNAMGR